MKKIFLLILTISIYTKCIAQINNDLIIEHIERISENSGDEISDYSELVEAYWSLIDNPININSDDIDRLADFKLLSIFQLENIKSYRKEFGDYQFIEELYEVEGIDENSIAIIKDIIFDRSYIFRDFYDWQCRTTIK